MEISCNSSIKQKAIYNSASKAQPYFGQKTITPDIYERCFGKTLRPIKLESESEVDYRLRESHILRRKSNALRQIFSNSRHPHVVQTILENNIYNLLDACKKGNVAVVDSVMRGIRGLKWQEPLEECLEIASRYGRIKVVDKLLNLPSNLGTQKKSLELPLVYASEFNQAAIVDRLLETPSGIKFEPSAIKDAVYIASWKGHHRMVGKLLKAPANLNNNEKALRECLNVASEYGHAGVVDELLKGSSRLGASKTALRNAFQWASKYEHKPVIERLKQEFAARTAQKLFRGNRVRKSLKQKA